MPEQTLREDELLVQVQGKLRFPDDVLDTLGLEAKDPVSVELILDGESEPVTFTRKLDKRRRVTIPHPIRHRHGIDEGDYVDVEVGAP